MREQFCADMFAAAGYIFGFGRVAMIASFLYVWVMRIPGVLTLVIWGLIVACRSSSSACSASRT